MDAFTHDEGCDANPSKPFNNYQDRHTENIGLSGADARTKSFQEAINELDIGEQQRVGGIKPMKDQFPGYETRRTSDKDLFNAKSRHEETSF